MIRTALISILTISIFTGQSFAQTKHHLNEYSLKYSQAIKAKVLVPAGWHFNEIKSPGTNACVVSKEDPNRAPEIITGITINLDSYKKVNKFNISSFNDHFIKTIQQSEKIVSNKIEKNKQYDIFRAETLKTTRDGSKRHKWIICMVDDSAGYYYTFDCETLEETKDTNWQIFDTIINNFTPDSAK